MFDQVFENLQKATESSVKMQQEMFQKWIEGFPKAGTAMPLPNDAVNEWRKQWEHGFSDMLKRQKELVDKNYEAGIKALEDMSTVASARSPHEYQEKVTELYRKSFESLRQLSEAQMNEFRSASEKLSKMMTGSSVG
jgi:hypothetical protein